MSIILDHLRVMKGKRNDKKTPEFIVVDYKLSGQKEGTDQKISIEVKYI